MLRHAGKQYKCGLPGCPTILRTENELNNHRKLVHERENSEREFQCTHCPYAAKTKSQLVRHHKNHEQSEVDSNAGLLKCAFSYCTFKTKVTSHLKRHMRLHTGQKPYKCRHCTYACNNLENLRKHVLSTNKHPGKMIYECASCEGNDRYQTNFSKELRAHLLEEHPDKYPTSSDASSYVANIFGNS